MVRPFVRSTSCAFCPSLLYLERVRFWWTISRQNPTACLLWLYAYGRSFFLTINRRFGPFGTEGGDLSFRGFQIGAE